MEVPDQETAAITAIYEDRRGRLWIGFWGHGLARFERGDVVFYTRRDGLVSDDVRFITEDREGALWLGTNTGLSRLGDGVFESYTQEDGLPAGMVRAIHEDDDGTLWIGTYGGGLGRLRDGEVTRITMQHGLYDNVVTRILEDERGNLWMLGNRGLYYANRRDLNAFADGEKTSVFSVAFGRAEGMVEGSGSRQPAGWRTEAGKMWWPTMDGVAMIDAGSFRVDPLPPPVEIERALAGRRGLATEPAVVLPANQRDLEIRYTALSFVAPERIRFKYKMEGHDDDWRGTTRGPRSLSGSCLRGDARGGPTASTLAFVVVVLSYLRWQQERVERERALIRRLRAFDKLKDEFLANTSHELRTPLYGMTGLAESLIDGVAGELPATAKANLSMIVASGRRLSHLVGDILDFSKLRHKNLELDRRPVDLRVLTEVVLTLSRPLVVEVSAESESDQLVVHVRDTGIGIPEEKQEQIFQAFQQADGAVDREYGGTGLGLAVTTQLVELHGGRTWVESSPGEGSCFSFSLPGSSRELDEPAPAPAVRIPAVEPASESPAPNEVVSVPDKAVSAPDAAARILIVDDEPVNRQVLLNYLSTQNLDVTAASSGEEALRMLLARPFDLVLLDVMMPKMSGYEVCRVLRESRPLELPVIFLTAKNHAQDVVTGLGLGANDYLTKPISKGELIARVRPHLDLVQVYRNLEEQVEEKMAQVKVLRGLLPICSSCKKIRDDEGYWSQLEVFIGRHSEAHFSHGICPDCLEEYYGKYLAESEPR